MSWQRRLRDDDDYGDYLYHKRKEEEMEVEHVPVFKITDGANPKQKSFNFDKVKVERIK